MAENNLHLQELSAEDIARAASEMTLTHGVVFEGGTSYMDDAIEIPEPQTEDILEEEAPAPPSPDGLADIDVPQISDDEALPDQPREDRGLYDPLNARRPIKKRPPEEYDLDTVATPQISDDEALPDQPPEDRGNSTGDPFAQKRPRKKRRPAEEYDLVHIEVPEISDDQELPLYNDDDDEMVFHHKKGYVPQSYDLEQIDVPQFSDSEELPDIGPVYVKPEEIKKPRRRRFEDDFPAPIKAAPTGGHTASYGTAPVGNMYRPAPAPQRTPAPDNGFPPPVRPASPAPAPQRAYAQDDGFPQPIKAVPPAPKPSAPAPQKSEDPSSGGLFKKLFGKK